MSFLDADFWVGAGVTAGVYAIFALGLQLNVGFTGLINLGQAGLMAIGAYAMGMLVVYAGWPLLFALPGAILVSIAAGALVGLPTLRLRADYFGIVTIAFSEIVRYTLQNAAFAGGNQGVLGYDADWRDFEAWALSKLAPLGLSGTIQLPLLIAVWGTLLICLTALKVLQRSPWGRVLKAIREDEDAAAALVKNVFAFKLQSLAIAAALAAIAGFFLALNVTYLYPSEFDPSFTFFGYAALILGGFASYWGVVAGAIVLCALTEGLRFLDLPLSSSQAGSLRFTIVELILVILSMFRPQGLLGSKAEMQLRS
jgi:branched-chain amino acid transport system permease protein